MGKKGELYIPKNLKPGDEISVEVRGDEIIKKPSSIFDVLMEEPVSNVPVEELRDVRNRLSKLLRT